MIVILENLELEEELQIVVINVIILQIILVTMVGVGNRGHGHINLCSERVPNHQTPVNKNNSVVAYIGGSE